MNPYFDDTITELSSQVRRFATDRLKPGFLGRRVLDRQLMLEMGALGILGPELPTDFGGQGMNCVATGAIIEEIARADLSMSLINLMTSLEGQILSHHGRPEVVGPWLRKMTAGEALVAIALTEPQGGSDAANLQLRIERTGDEYVLTGEKTSISAATQAEATVVFGRTGGPDSGAKGITALLVPLNTPGVTVAPLHCHGQKAIGRGSIFFDGTRVPVENRLGDEGKGFSQVMQGFDYSRALIALQVIAVAQVTLEETWAYVRERQSFGKPLTSFQGVSHTLAEFETLLTAARLLCYQSLWLKDQGAAHSSEAAMSKWWAPKVAYDAIHQCLLLHGHGGYSEGVIEQRLRDVLGFQIADGTSQIMKTIVARSKVGRDAIPN